MAPSGIPVRKAEELRPLHYRLCQIAVPLGVIMFCIGSVGLVVLSGEKDLVLVKALDSYPSSGTNSVCRVFYNFFWLMLQIRRKNTGSQGQNMQIYTGRP